MASNVGSGSPLASVAAKARAVQRTRATLGIGATSPNAGVRPGAPPSPPPAATSAGAEIPIPAPPEGVDPNSREAMLSQAKSVLDQASSKQLAIQSPNPPPPTQLGERLTQLGATGLTPSRQFQRLAGRPPSGRELVVYTAYQQLSQELGRPPTRTELTYRVTTSPGSANIEPLV